MTRVIRKQWPVESDSHPGEYHTVTQYQDDSWGCSCPHFLYRLNKAENAGLGLTCKHIDYALANPRSLTAFEEDIVLQKNLRFLGGAVKKARAAIKTGALDDKSFKDFYYRTEQLEAAHHYHEDRAALFETHRLLLEAFLPDEVLTKARGVKPTGCASCVKPCEDLDQVVPRLVEAREDPWTLTDATLGQVSGVLYLAGWYRERADSFQSHWEELRVLVPSVLNIVHKPEKATP